MRVVVPFVAGGVAAAEPTLVAVQERQIENLRAALGEAPQGVTLRSAEQWYETSARTREKFGRWAAENSRSGRVRLISEPLWAVGSDAQIRDWARHESVLNQAFADHPLTLICPYDGAALPDEVIAHARGTHPEIVDAAGVSDSDTYEDPIDFCRRLDAAVHPESGEAWVETGFEVEDLPSLRRLATSCALNAGLTRERADELALAVNEVATNALVHGRAPATLRIWSADRELAFEVSDAGDGIDDPLVGQLTPDSLALGGRGVWLTRLICDAVEIRDGTGCTVTMRVTTPPTGSPLATPA